MISKEVPGHLVVAARTGFLTTIEAAAPAYGQIAEVVTMTAASMDLVDLGGSPMPVENLGRPQVQEFIEKRLAVKPKDWEIVTFISYNAVADDQTGTLDRKVRGVGLNFNKHLAQLAFKTLNDGESIIGYDGLPLFSASHIDKGASYQTPQDNQAATALDIDTLEDGLVAARKFRDDQGNFVDMNYNLLVVSPELERTAAGLTSKNLQPYVVSSQSAVNPYAGTLAYVVSNQLDTTAAILVASSEAIKPILIVMREAPNLQSAWFDPKAPDGGRYYFKFYARYNHYVGDWRLVYMINT